MSGAANGGSEKPSGGPRKPITDTMKKPLAKRFYKLASVAEEGSCRIFLDGRPVKTPKKRELALPNRTLALAVAEEWQAQDAHIDPASMPLTRFANTAIDAVADNLADVAADIAAFAGSDLVCYRAEAPSELIALQARHWDPVLTWAADALGARFKTGAGIMPVEQPEAALLAFAEALDPHEAFRLSGLHVLTTLTGSAILALARSKGFLDADATWAAAHVDEDYQIALWGEDDEAAARRRSRRAEFDAANRLLELLQ